MIDIVVGGMYGDEGKGKIVNYLARKNNYDYIFRVNASTNASHTVEIDGKVYITKQLPSSFGCNSSLVVSPGAVMNLLEFKEELYSRPDIENLRENVFVAGTIPIILPGYIESEKNDGRKNSIGTTNQGTGVAQIARVARHAVTLFDVKRATRSGFMKLVDKIQASYDSLGIERTHSECVVDASMLCDTYLNIINIIDSFCVDYSDFLFNLEHDANILVEGCNGVMLDNVHGLWPYVTSCSTTVAALMGYANLSLDLLRDTYLVMGIYNVCLNKRPFLTEIKDQPIIDRINSVTNEVDPAENMMRRIGWFDVPAARRALLGHRNCKLILTKLDALDGDIEGKMCTHYKGKNKTVLILPDDVNEIESYEPVYKSFDTYDAFITMLETLLDVEIPFVSDGKDSSKIIEWR
jgi:adenylosuccinate synthase